jgi:3-phenylpropionate/cinnamic acid dioxygenase small subunit
VAAPDDELNIVYDDFNRIRDRINRITGGDAHSQDPPSATVRVLGRVRVSEASSAWLNSPASEWVAQANFTLVELRRDIQTTYVGTFTYGLVRRDDGLRLVAKRVDLLNSESPLGNLTIIL